VRSHAKAAFAGATQRQAKGLGRIFRGALATRDGSLSVKGSSAPQAKRPLLPIGTLAAILALVLSTGSASAADGVVNFFGASGEEGGKFFGTGGVAVNQEGSGGASAGDVYVVDPFSNRVQQFSAAGAFIRAFGLNVGEAGVHVCTVAASCTAGTASAEAAGMSFPQGIAIDQTNGNVYVTDQGNARVDVFSANGTFQAAFGYGVDTGAAALEICTAASTCQAGSTGANAGQFSFQLGYPAVAPAGSPNAGDLYVPNSSNNRVDQFEPTLTAGEVTGITFVKGFGWGVDTGAAEFEQCTTASVCQEPNTSSPTSNPGQFGFGQPRALAVDSNGNLYTAESSENNRAQKFTAAGNPALFGATELNGFPGPIDIAVDTTNDHVFAIKQASGSNEKRILEFNASGAFIATHAEGTTISSANGFAVVEGTTNFYVSTENGVPAPGFFFGPPGVFFLGTKVPPTANVEAPSPLSSHSATIKGKVNPQGFSTSYRFEFSSDGGFTWSNVPAADVSLGNGSSDIAVSQVVNGLVGGHEYRYRIVATKPFGAGTTTSFEEVFTTPASAPTVPATFSTAVTTKTAVLEAEINPNHETTTYHFEYGTADCSANPCASIPVPDAGIGSGGAPVKVSKEVSGLQPGTTYHFRVVATNTTGTSEGPDTTFNTYGLPATNTSCPNQPFRIGAGAGLPDCRAYEMVSPVDKNNGDIITACDTSCYRTALNQSAVGGDKFTFSAIKAFAGAPAGHYSNQYLATRGADGWVTKGIGAPQGTTVLDPSFAAFYDLDVAFQAFSDDLSNAWLFDVNQDPLTPDAQAGLVNLYRLDNGDGSFEALTTAAPIAPPPDRAHWLGLQGLSADGGHAFFISTAALTPDAVVGDIRKIYQFHEGQIDLISVLPGGGAPSQNAWIGNVFDSRSATRMHAVSADGSRVFWVAGNFATEAKLYARIDGTTTVPISEVPGTQFWTASTDGSKAVYGTPKPGESEVESLYLSDVDTETSTPIAGDVRGVLGASDDASYIYYASKEALDAGATAGEWNLYLYHEGASNFIATLSSIDVPFQGLSFASAFSNRPITHSGRVTPDGRHIAFTSTRSLTGYDNTDAVNGEPDLEVFRYAADTEELTCVSCNPSGARPNGDRLRLPYSARSRASEEAELDTKVWAAAWLNTQENALYAPRTLSEDGSRLFFNSFDALVPSDNNGKQDVYQWEAQGTGGCTASSASFAPDSGGCVDLISSGESSRDSEFVDATPSGDNVFISTESSLVHQDPALIDIYNARVNGGYPPPPPPPPPCVGDACQSIPAGPNDPTPASASFRGAGDPVAKKPRRSCRASSRKAKGSKQAQRKRAKRCRRANRRTGR
jgi:NHL repeat-containing protein